MRKIYVLFALVLMSAIAYAADPMKLLWHGPMVQNGVTLDMRVYVGPIERRSDDVRAVAVHAVTRNAALHISGVADVVEVFECAEKQVQNENATFTYTMNGQTSTSGPATSPITDVALDTGDQKVFAYACE